MAVVRRFVLILRRTGRYGAWSDLCGGQTGDNMDTDTQVEGQEVIHRRAAMRILMERKNRS